jgi:hypothetical protein
MINQCLLFKNDVQTSIMSFLIIFWWNLKTFWVIFWIEPRRSDVVVTLTGATIEDAEAVVTFFLLAEDDGRARLCLRCTSHYCLWQKMEEENKIKNETHANSNKHDNSLLYISKNIIDYIWSLYKKN